MLLMHHPGQVMKRLCVRAGHGATQRCMSTFTCLELALKSPFVSLVFYLIFIVKAADWQMHHLNLLQNQLWLIKKSFVSLQTGSGLFAVMLRLVTKRRLLQQSIWNGNPKPLGCPISRIRVHPPFTYWILPGAVASGCLT